MRARADELAASGMPYQLAMAVALGRLPLNEALERMATQQQVQKAMDKHGLSRALATQVILGHVPLELVLSRRRLQAHRDENRTRSCIDEAKASGHAITFGLHGKKRVTGKVVDTDAYLVKVAPTEGDSTEPVEIHKLQIKFAHEPEGFKKLRKALKYDPTLEKAPKEPIARPQDRYTLSDKRLFRCLDDKVLVGVTLLEGEQLKGTVAWFGRYEFGLQLKGGDLTITVFRHAVADFHDQ